VASTGGFETRNVTPADWRRSGAGATVIDLMRETCSPPEPGQHQHRATIFVVDAPHFEQI
jgi:hypothetical protein